MKMKLKLIMAGLFLFFAANSIAAGYVANSVSVLSVKNIVSNQDASEIIVDSSTNCSGNKIKFPLSVAPSKEAHMRAYSSALTALTTSMKVTVYSYADSNECMEASFIWLQK